MPTTHSKKKKRIGFCEWFRDTINKGMVEGLVWMDKEKTLVRVPWKRVDKPGFRPNEDAKLFKLYAEHTEKYRAGDQEDPSTWKTRFRCALRKMNEIEEQKDKCDLEGDLPYRTFKFVEKKSCKDKSKRGSSTDDRLSKKPSPITGGENKQFPWSGHFYPDCQFDNTRGGNAVPYTTDEYPDDYDAPQMPFRPFVDLVHTRIPDLDNIEKETLLGGRDHSTDQSARETTQWLMSVEALSGMQHPFWPDCQYAEFTSAYGPGMFSQEFSVCGQYQ